jgi:hypothetical protein
MAILILGVVVPIGRGELLTTFLPVVWRGASILLA